MLSAVRAGRAAILTGLLAAAFAGCIDVDGELAANGTLEFRYTYDPPNHATFASERARLGSAHVRVEKIERDRSLPDYPPEEFVTATVIADDPRQLGSAAAFAGVTVEPDLAAGRLAVSFPGLPADVRAQIASSTDRAIEARALRLRLTVPGPVTHAEPVAAVDGRVVTWTMSFRQLSEQGETVHLTVAWTPPAS